MLWPGVCAPSKLPQIELRSFSRQVSLTYEQHSYQGLVTYKYCVIKLNSNWKYFLFILLMIREIA